MNNKKLKISQVVSTFPPKIGGMGQVCFEEFIRLKNRGMEVEVLAPNHNNLSSVLSSLNGGLLPVIYNKIKKSNIVHLHYPFYGGMEFVWLASKFREQPYIITYHMDAQAQGFFGIIQKIYDIVLSKRILQGATKVITIDKDHLDNSKFGKFIDKNKIVEIFNGVDLEVFSPRKKKSAIKLSFDNTKLKTILFVGNLLPFKRFDLLLKAFKKIVENIYVYPIKIKVIGGNFEENKLKQIAKDLDISDKVEFAGEMTDREKLAQEYRQAYCTVVSSDCGESFSLIAVESLSCGTPVVVSNIPGVRSRVIDGQTGYLFESGSVKDLSLKLKNILELSKENYIKMSDACRQDAEDKYNWDRHINKLIKLYNLEIK